MVREPRGAMSTSPQGSRSQARSGLPPRHLTSLRPPAPPLRPLLRSLRLHSIVSYAEAPTPSCAPGIYRPNFRSVRQNNRRERLSNSFACLGRRVRGVRRSVARRRRRRRLRNLRRLGAFASGRFCCRRGRQGIALNTNMSPSIRISGNMLPSIADDLALSSTAALSRRSRSLSPSPLPSPSL